MGKGAGRERMLATRAADSHCAIVYVNQVGGQDELVFDGASLVFDHEGTLLARGEQFAEELLVVDVPIPPVYRKRLLDPRGRVTRRCCRPSHVSEHRSCRASRPAAPVTEPFDAERELYDALGARHPRLLPQERLQRRGDRPVGRHRLHDRRLHRGRRARRRARARRVDAVALLERSFEVRRQSCSPTNLGVDYRTIPIEPAFQAYLDMLAPSFEGREPGLTYENIQSRCRGQTLMALSNEFGWMVLTTGNKSEMAVGYFTIYGDSVGGYGVIKDVLKTRVYDLCRYVNSTAGREVVPEGVITKPPSAELRPDQRDDQSLPPYEVLDPILELYIEDDRTAGEIVELGHDEAVVRRITRLVDIAEYKRRQCPPGVRVSTKAFGKDRRLPITNGYRG